MPIYTISNQQLSPVEDKKFDLEKDIQLITERNLLTLFGLMFISGGKDKEFFVRAQEQDFYIDTLAFDESQRSFVIIEYKKDRSFSVIDQGFAYLSAMLNHKADFVLELNEKLGKSFTKNDIDWESSRIIFVSPEFTNYQKNAINWKDLPIYLYEVNLYENNLIEYDAIRPYRTTESISKISKDKTIEEVSKVVKVYEDSDIIRPTTRPLFEQFREQVLSLGSDIEERTTKTYIAYRIHGTNFVYVGPRANQFNLAIRINKPTIPSGMSLVLGRNRAWDTTPVWNCELKSPRDIANIMSVISQAYKEYRRKYHDE